MDAKNGTLIGGLGGAALVAMLVAGPSRVTSTPPAIAPPVSAQLTENAVSNNILRATLDQSGPWSALCEEFVTGVDDLTTNSVVSVGTLPNGAAPGATEATVKHGDVESRVPVHNYPTNINLAACTRNHAVQTMIATVPDPVRSHMQLEFDRTVAGIVRGAGAGDFALQRYWFPWSPGSPQDRQKILEDQRQLRLRQPGVLIFRHTEVDQDDRLAIFLVSETPTAGLNRVQFSNALDYVHQLQTKATSQIRIAGPRFSASLPVLEELLKSFMSRMPSETRENSHPFQRFSVYSPSTTNGVLMDRFVNELPGIDFFTFQIRDDDMLKWVLATLEKMSYRPEEIATLSEDESAYGVGQEPEGLEEEAAQYARQPRVVLPSRSSTGSSANDPVQHILRLQFPRDLSSVRNAVEDKTSSQDTARELGIPLLSVPLSLHEQPQNEHDSPPPYATQQAAADLDRELQSMVARLRENNCQAIVLLASNPLDRLFLLDYLHRTLPDVRLVTAESDALMLHRPGYVDLSGTIIATGLPVIPDARSGLWREPGATIDLLASSATEFRNTGEEASFLAIWSLFAAKSNAAVGRWETSVNHARPGAVLPGVTCEPNLVTGAGGFVLLSSKMADPVFPCTTARPEIAGVTQHLESAPRLWKAFLFLLSLAATMHIVLMLVNVFTSQCDAYSGEVPTRTGFFAKVTQFVRWELYRVTPAAQAGIVAISTQRKQSSDLGAEKLFLLLGLTNQLLLFTYLAGRTSFVRWIAFHGSPLFLQLLVAGAYAAAPVALMIVGVATFAKLCRRPKSPHRVRLIRNGAIGALFVLWTILTWEHLLKSGGDVPNWGVAYRSMHLFAGLSPLAAIGAVLAGYMAWALTHLRRIEHIQTSKVHLSFQLPEQPKDEEGIAAKRIEDLETGIHNSIQGAIHHGCVLAVLLLPMLVLLRITVALRGVEVSNWHVWGLTLRFSPFSLTVWSLVWGFMMLLAVIIHSIHTNWHMWGKLRALLQHLNGTPIHDVFEKIAGDTSSLQVWKIGGTRRSLLLQHRTLELMRQMQPAQMAQAAVVGGAPRMSPQQALRAQLNELGEMLYACDAPARGWMNRSLVPKISGTLNLLLPQVKRLLVHYDPKSKDPAELQNARYLALRMAALIRYSMVQIRNMLWFCLWGYVFLLLSVRLYPFQGRHTLSMLMTALFIVLLLAIGGMFSQMESDPVLGRLEDARTRNVGESSFLGVAGKLLSVGGVPLLAVLASQFPAFAELISGWIKPISDALH